MLPVVAALFLGYLAYLFYEKWANDRAVRSFQHIIHVNGIRGTTSVCRLIDAHLRGAGYRVFTKTTGSTPCYIDTQGQEHKIRRWGNANIGEQLSIIRRAHRQKAQILIIECMAVQPELQRIARLKAKAEAASNAKEAEERRMGKKSKDIFWLVKIEHHT